MGERVGLTKTYKQYSANQEAPTSKISVANFKWWAVRLIFTANNDDDRSVCLLLVKSKSTLLII